MTHKCASRNRLRERLPEQKLLGISISWNTILKLVLESDWEWWRRKENKGQIQLFRHLRDHGSETWCELEETLVMHWPCWQKSKVKVARCKIGILLWWLLIGKCCVEQQHNSEKNTCKSSHKQNSSLLESAKKIYSSIFQNSLEEFKYKCSTQDDFSRMA